AEELQRLPPPRDASPLQRALARLHKQGDVAGRYEALEKELRRGQKQAEIDLKKLPLWKGSLEELEPLSIPPEEIIAAFEERLNGAGIDLQRLSEQRGEASRRVSELDQRLRQLDLEHDVPTEESLSEARRRRDACWRDVRALLRDGARQPEDGESLEAAFERSVVEADALADRLRREAERVGVKSQLMAERDAQRDALAELSTAVEAAEAKLAEAEDQWRRQWTAAGLAPLSPREMRSWRRMQAELVAAAESLRRQSEEVAGLRSGIDACREELRDCLAKLAMRPEDDEAPLADLTAMCEAALKTVQDTELRREQVQRDAARQEREAKAAGDALEQARQALDAWRTRWGGATERLRLQHDSDPTVASAVLDAIDALFAKIREAESLTAERIEPIAAEARLFAQNVKTVCEGAAPDLLNIPYPKATTELHHRLEKARQARDRLAELQKLCDRERERKAAADESLIQADAELELLCREAGSSPDQLLAVEQKAQRQRELQSRLEEIESRLRHEAAGKPLGDLVAEAMAEDADHLSAAAGRLQQEIREATAELEQVNQTIGEESAELKRMDGSAVAAAAQEEAEQLVAQLRDESERYVRLRLAAEVLQLAIQRHREKNQGPVLQRAGDLFRELTLGSFDRLAVDYNDAGEPVLVGVRPGGGQKVGVEGMSDGSCDQLYLALRLASLEHYLDRHPPLPFIVDDILLTFDDDRAAAALRVLGDLSRRTQVLFFTHHHRLVELAKKHLPGPLVHFHRLPSPIDSTTNGEEQKENDPHVRTLFA
ncbi:MAG: hypothetical protein KY475_09235, partial [Planctomycetes bacterium]|nr:hypothetical protein [Planctomycetota bacterium]